MGLSHICPSVLSSIFTFKQARESSGIVAPSLIASLSRAVNDLDRVSAWLTISGTVNVAPGFVDSTGVIGGCSHLLLEVFGLQIGAAHASTAIGVAPLPLDSAMVIAAEIALSS